MNRNEGQKPWGFRRKVISYTLLFCGGCVAWIMVKGSASSGDTIVSGCFTLATGIIGSYIFGAVWHDKGDGK